MDTYSAGTPESAAALHTREPGGSEGVMGTSLPSMAPSSLPSVGYASSSSQLGASSANTRTASLDPQASKPVRMVQCSGRCCRDCFCDAHASSSIRWGRCMPSTLHAWAASMMLTVTLPSQVAQCACVCPLCPCMPQGFGGAGPSGDALSRFASPNDALSATQMRFQTIEECEVDMRKIIGSGAYGKVWLAEWTGVEVAVKELFGFPKVREARCAGLAGEFRGAKVCTCRWAEHLELQPAAGKRILARHRLRCFCVCTTLPGPAGPGGGHGQQGLPGAHQRGQHAGQPHAPQHHALPGGGLYLHADCAMLMMRDPATRCLRPPNDCTPCMQINQVSVEPPCPPSPTAAATLPCVSQSFFSQAVASMSWLGRQGSER